VRYDTDVQHLADEVYREGQNIALSMDTPCAYCPLARRDCCRVYTKGCFYG
jgi:hypothetical protein